MSEQRELHDRPTVTELLEAVREFLERDVMSHVTGRVQFHTRVAVNVLGIVQRELEHPEMLDAHQARLHGLGFDDDASLAAAIRSGALDDRFEEVLNAVRASVEDKLAVANPTYANPTDKSKQTVAPGSAERRRGKRQRRAVPRSETAPEGRRTDRNVD